MDATTVEARPSLLRRVWPLRVAIGVVTVVIGVLVLAWPVRTLLVVAVLLGVELVVLGLVRVAAAVAVPMSRNLRLFALVMGVLTVLAGVFCFLRPSASLFVLAIFFAAGFVADGVADLARVKTAGPTGRARLAVVLSGVVSIVAGLVVALFPGASLVLLAQVSGAVLVVVGIIQVVAALAARPARTTTRG